MEGYSTRTAVMGLDNSNPEIVLLGLQPDNSMATPVVWRGRASEARQIAAAMLNLADAADDAQS